MLPESQMKVTLSQNEFSLTFTKHCYDGTAEDVT